MQTQNQFGKILSVVTIAVFAAPAIATPSPTTQELKARGSASSKPSRTADPNNPTWQEYHAAGIKAAWAKDADKARKYAEASFIQMAKSMSSTPPPTLSKKDQLVASSLCVQKMYADGTAIMKGPDGSNMTDPKDLEELVEEQQKHFGVMSTAHSILKKLSPQGADQVAFEITKCSAVMAKTKNKLEKAQAQSKTETKTQ